MFNKFSTTFFFIVLTVSIFGLFVSWGQKKEPADLVLMNGKIVVIDEVKPEAEALAVRGDVILAVGRNKKIKRFITQETKVINLEGKLAISSFIDAHGHFTSLGQAKMPLDLMKVKNWDEVVVMVEEAVKKGKPGEWTLGRGWHQADIIVLSKDIMTVPDDEILSAEVIYTIVGGKVLYSKNKE